MFLKPINVIQSEVGEWSRNNFGAQCSKLYGVDLHEIAPLLGVSEEIGELVSSSTREQELDAIGDIMVYLCDFSARFGIQAIVATPEQLGEQDALDFNEDPLSGIIICAGRLTHVILKTHQGIREFTSVEYAKEQATKHLSELLYCVSLYCTMYLYPMNAEVILNNVWTQTVSKRNWKTNPSNG